MTHTRILKHIKVYKKKKVNIYKSRSWEGCDPKTNTKTRKTYIKIL